MDKQEYKEFQEELEGIELQLDHMNKVYGIDLEIKNKGEY